MDQGTVFVVGAGPAGLFAARKIATAGHEVLILNRDIKPGGLAEYGIYPQKFHMKNGLRKQFGKILAMPNVEYIGNARVRTDERLTIEGLKDWRPSAIVFAVGAQGTKNLGLPGEDARGVYSAKDFVYHYNVLPPFASQDFSTGRRVAIVGMGNVMADIARWLEIRRVREIANKEIEDKRAQNLLGSSLQAELDIHASGKTFDALAALGDDLRFVLITSRATVQRADADTLRVEVTPSAHAKCERCWHYRADVGSDRAHPGLCGRCVSNLFGGGEARQHA